MNEIFRILPTDIIIYEIFSHIQLRISRRKPSIIKKCFGYYYFDDSRMIYNFFINIMIDSVRTNIPLNTEYIDINNDYILNKLSTRNNYKKIKIRWGIADDIDLSHIEHVKDLDINTYNSIKLPQSVTNIKLATINIKDIIYYNLNDIKSIVFMYCRTMSSNINLVKFTSLYKVVLYKCKLKHIPSKLPINITYLDLSCNYIQIIENLSSKLKYLDLSDNEIVKIDNIPETTTHIYINKNYIKNITNLPKRIITLSLYNGHDRVPCIDYKFNQHSIKYLNINKSSIRLCDFPKDIEILKMSIINLCKFNNFPKSLTTLIIRDSKKQYFRKMINNMKTFPKKLYINIRVLVTVNIIKDGKPKITFSKGEYSKFDNVVKKVYCDMCDMTYTTTHVIARKKYITSIKNYKLDIKNFLKVINGVQNLYIYGHDYDPLIKNVIVAILNMRHINYSFCKDTLRPCPVLYSDVNYNYKELNMKYLTLNTCSKHNRITNDIAIMSYRKGNWIGESRLKIIDKIRVLSPCVIFNAMKLNIFNKFQLTQNVRILLMHNIRGFNKIPTHLPNTIEVLHICKASISKIENIPSKVIELGLAANNINTIENIPKTVRILILGGNRITNIKQNISFVDILEINSGKRKKKLLRNYISDKLIFYTSGCLCDRLSLDNYSTMAHEIINTYSHVLHDYVI